MTLHKDQDPGWWRRGMTPRGFKIVIIVCVGLIAIGLGAAAILGIPFF